MPGRLTIRYPGFWAWRHPLSVGIVLWALLLWFEFNFRGWHNSLFSITRYTRISSNLVGMLIRARRRNLVNFEGEMLWQRRDDQVPIIVCEWRRQTSDDVWRHNRSKLLLGQRCSANLRLRLSLHRKAFVSRKNTTNNQEMKQWGELVEIFTTHFDSTLGNVFLHATLGSGRLCVTIISNHYMLLRVST